MIGHAYTPDADLGALTDWPFTNPDSHYVITRGNPQASGRIDAGGAGQVTRYGIWRCTAGAFTCVEQGDEMMTVLNGTGTLTDHDTGQVIELYRGVSLFIRDAARVTWDITDDLTKVFHGHKADGYA